MTGNSNFPRTHLQAQKRLSGQLCYRYIADALHVSHTQARTDVMEAETKVETHFTPEPPVTTETPESVNTDDVETNFTPETETTAPHVSSETPVPEKRIEGKDGKSYPDRQPQRSNGTKAKTSAADKQLAGVINLLMKHAHQWDEKHWHAFLEVVQNLRGNREVPATE